MARYFEQPQLMEATLRVAVAGFAIATGLVLTSPVLAQGANCDPADFMVQNIERIDYNLSTWLAYVNILQESRDQRSTSGLDLSYGGFALDFDAASSIKSYLEQQVRYSQSRDESLSVLRTTLGPQQADMYIACLNASQPLLITPDPGAATATTFNVTVSWRGAFGVDNADLSLTVIGGEILDGAIIRDNISRISTTMQHNESKSFIVLRSGNGEQQIRISASINGSVSDTLVLPPLPQFSLRLRPLFTPDVDEARATIVRGGGAGNSLVRLPACIHRTDDSTILVAGTARWEETGGAGTELYRAAWTVGPVDGVSTCGEMSLSAWDDIEQYRTTIYGRYRVLEAYTVPITY